MLVSNKFCDFQDKDHVSDACFQNGSATTRLGFLLEHAQTAIHATGTVRMMSQSWTPEPGKIALPLLTSERRESGQPAPAWHGWSAVTPLPEPSALTVEADSPEPQEPQGAYGVDLG